jgi:hypothetical protein
MAKGIKVYRYELPTHYSTPPHVYTDAVRKEVDEFEAWEVEIDAEKARRWERLSPTARWFILGRNDDGV